MKGGLIYYFLLVDSNDGVHHLSRLNHLTGVYRHGLSELSRLHSLDREQKEHIARLNSTVASYKDCEDNGLPNSYSELMRRFNTMFTERQDGVTEPKFMKECREKQALEAKLSAAVERNARLEKKRLELQRVRRIARHQHMRLKACYDDGDDEEGYKSWSSTDDYRLDLNGTNSYYAKNGVPIELQQSPDSSPRGGAAASGDATMTMHSVSGLPGFAWNSRRGGAAW